MSLGQPVDIIGFGDALIADVTYHLVDYTKMNIYDERLINERRFMSGKCIEKCFAFVTYICYLSFSFVIRIFIFTMPWLCYY